jgi:dienelactone hydrolase
MDKKFNHLVQMIEEAGKFREFQEEEISCEKCDGFVIRELMIDMEPIKGEKARIYTIIGIPESAGKLPTVLHIHGGGQTASKDYVKHWASLGYFACSYDWTGPAQDRTRYSNLAELPSGQLSDEYDPEKSVMLTRLLIARCMVSYLATQPEVDSGHIGAFGISWGGAILWLLNHWDKRLKAAVPIYGCGRHISPDRNYIYGKPCTQEDRVEWSRVFDGIERAAGQNAPVLMMAATNDFWGWIDAAEDAVARVSPDKRNITFSPNHNHHLDAWAISTINRWMYVHLKEDGKWPHMPAVEVRLNASGRLMVQARYDATYEKPAQVRFCWSWKDYSEIIPPARYWHVTDLLQPDAEVEIPVLEPQNALYIYADVIYRDGSKISSLPLRLSPSYLGMKQSTDLKSDIIADFRNGQDGWYCPIMWTEPIHSEFKYGYMNDPQGGKAITIEDKGVPFIIRSFKLSDPKWQGNDRCRGMAVRVYASNPGTWEVVAVYRPWCYGEKAFKYKRGTSEGWSTLYICKEDFCTEEGLHLSSWIELHELIVSFIPHDNPEQGIKAALGNIIWQR